MLQNLKKYFNLIFLIPFLFVVFIQTNVEAIGLPSESTLDFFDMNNIFYYNPVGSFTGCVTNSANLAAGNTIEEKIWNYFVNANISGVSNNPSVIAGIMGNLYVESGYDPFLQGGGGSYVGIYQTEPSNIKPLVEAQYGSSYWYNGSVGNPNKYAEDIEVGAIIIELNQLTQKNERFYNNFVNHLDKVSNQSGEAGAASYAELFEVEVERAVCSADMGACHSYSQPLEDPVVQNYVNTGLYPSLSKYHNTPYQGVEKRRNYAKEIYNKYSGSSGPTSDQSSSSITWSDGWITGGLEGYVKESAIGTAVDDAANQDFSNNGGKPNKITLHNTEGTGIGLGAYSTCTSSGKKCPAHFTIDIKKRQTYQHFPITKTSAAIKAYDGYAGIQIEIVGFTGSHPESNYYLRNSSNFSSEDWAYLAKILISISNETSIPLTSTVSWEPNAPRLSAEEFKSYTGILGHMHAPENDHGDPAGIWQFLEPALRSQGGTTISCPSIGSQSGGLTEDQAQKIAAYYKTDEATQGYSLPSDAGKWNCVSFSAWFVQKFTSIGKVNGRSWGNGKDTAHYLANDYQLPSGAYPQPFSVFSVTKGSTMCGSHLCGHTGIVVAVNGNDVTTIEAAYGQTGYTAVVHRTIDYFVNTQGDSYKFTYLDSILNQTEINNLLGSL